MFTGMPDFQQSVELMKNMWSNAAKGSTDTSTPGFGLPGMSALNPFGIPTMDIEELEKRIKDLKSVEAWLSLNLNVLQTTIQGLEVQKATLATLQGIAKTMQTSHESGQQETSTAAKEAPDLSNAGGQLAKNIMEHMSKSMTTMMASFPSEAQSARAPVKKSTPNKPARKTTAGKTTKPRVRRSGV